MLTDTSNKRKKEGYLRCTGRGQSLIFQYNPTTILEKRSVKYHFSEAQGQVLPLAQFGMIEPTEIEFELFMHKHKGLKEELAILRSFTLPKTLSRPQYYQQVSPHKYELNLNEYFIGVGVINSVEINILQYDKTTLKPIHLTAAISFTAISTSIDGDVTTLKSLVSAP